MPHKIHDHFSKQALAYLLELFGAAEVSYEVYQNLQVDVRFQPTVSPQELQPLGLLGRLVTRQALLEHFWNPPRKTDIRDCQLKLFLVQKACYNQACSEKQRLSEEHLPRLWLLTTSASPALLQSCGATTTPAYGDGVYFFAAVELTALVVLNQLPQTPETLWLRLLGRGDTRALAINDLRAVPRDHPYRTHLLKLFRDYRIQLEAKHKLTQTEQELIMQLSPAYYEWEKETIEKGRQEGQQEERRVFIRSLLKTRFGKLDQRLSKIINPLLELSPDQTMQWLLQSSREELLAKFGKTGNSS